MLDAVEPQMPRLGRHLFYQPVKYAEPEFDFVIVVLLNALGLPDRLGEQSPADRLDEGLIAICGL